MAYLHDLDPTELPGLHCTLFSFLCACCLKSFPTLKTSLLYAQTHPARDSGCPSVFLKPLYFKKDCLGESLQVWSVRGKSQGEEPQHTPLLFLIFCLYRLGREGDSSETSVRICDLIIVVLTMRMMPIFPQLWVSFINS